MKNNKFLYFLACVVFLWVLSGCVFVLMGIKGNGDIVSQERTFTAAEFNRVIAYGVGNINIYPSEDYKVIVTTDSNIQDTIGTEVLGNTLHIENIRENYNPTKLTIDVYLPELKAITLKGSGNIKINNGNGTDLEVVLSGSGNIDALKYQATVLNTTLSGSGNIKATATNSLNGNISGSGSITAQNNPVQNADISISGSGSAWVWVTGTLRGSISGSGSIFHKGNPAIKVNISGSGRVSHYSE